MDCPRCKHPLRKVDYEGVETDMCERCWGLWLDSGEFAEILTRRDYVFSPEETALCLDVRTASRAGKTTPAPCPKCLRTMERQHYDESVHLVIDRCPEHGVWLDTGEIKKAQALAEKSRAIHCMLIKKLGILPVRRDRDSHSDSES